VYIVPEMQKCFNVDRSLLEECEVIICQGIGSPIFCSTTRNPQQTKHQIVLDLVNGSFWCQLIYQLAHELSHYFLYLRKSDKKCSLPWIEETVCEAMALYILYFSGKHWGNCSLGKKNFKYFMSINKYLAKILSKNGTGELSTCQTIAQLNAINDSAETNRDMRHTEVLKLYRVIFYNPQDIIGLSNYTEYISLKNPLMLDTDKLLTTYGDNPVIKCFISFQPILE